jgi:hypothetical protein
MTAAVFGLIGVVVGALITGGTNYALQVRAEQREVRAATLDAARANREN